MYSFKIKLKSGKNMKRTHPDHEVPKRPTLIPLSTENRLKTAVKAALFQKGSDNLSNQPILIDCMHVRDHAQDFLIAYWPYDEEIGEKFVTYLDESTCDLETIGDNSDIINVINQVALHQTLVPSNPKKNKNSKNLQLLDSLFGPDSIDKLGLFLRVRTGGYRGVNHDDMYDDKEDLWFVNLWDLAPHLYSVESFAYYSNR